MAWLFQNDAAGKIPLLLFLSATLPYFFLFSNVKGKRSRVVHRTYTFTFLR